MDTDLTGQSLGRYHILEQLGEGGMATVYKAYDTRLETDVAVKIIRTENLPQSGVGQAHKRFEREAKSLARLTHPNIVKTTDFGEYDGRPYLIMPYLPGGTLKQRLGTPMHWEQAVRILLPISQGLHYAHQQGIVHRDVKPSNILITQSGEPMLTDFGIAKILLDTEQTAGITGTGVGIGTPEYMSPEQFQGRGVDARADVYSLGVVLYEMVTGRKPYQADTPAAILIKQATDPLPRPRGYVPSLPDAVEKVLLKALSKKPEGRYQSMAEFSIGLEVLLAKTKTTASIRPAGPLSMKVNPGLIGAGLVVLMGFGLFVAFQMRSLGQQDLRPTSTPIKSSESSEPTDTTNHGTQVPSNQDVSSTATPQASNLPLDPDLPLISRIRRNEDFNDLAAFELELHGNYILSNGLLILDEPLVAGDPWSDGSSSVYSTFPIKQGNGYLLLFRTTPGTTFLITFEMGPFDSNSFRAIWLENAQSVSLWNGRKQLVSHSLDFRYQPETWHYLLMWLNADGVEGRIWPQDNLELMEAFTVDTGTDWVTNGLHFNAIVARGILELDDFEEVEFSE